MTTALPNHDVFADMRLAHAAGWLLYLADTMSGNVPCLGDMLALVGLAMGHRDLAALIDRLEQAGFITSTWPMGAQVAPRCVALTRDGREVATQRVRCEWITLPD